MKRLLFVPLLAFAALSAQAQDETAERQSPSPEAGQTPHEPLDAEVQGLPEEQAAGNTAGSYEFGDDEPGDGVGAPGVAGREPGNDPLAAPDARNEDAASRARSAPAPEAGIAAGGTERLPEGEAAQGEQGQAHSLVRDFSEADRDADGILSIEEARQAFPASVEVIDSDNDGELSKLELQTGVPGLLFEEGGDASDQSRITEKEWEAVVQALESHGEDAEQDV